ncbi:phosphoribosylformylglycinamidine synthase subunit PurQ [Kamptonema cortianum]|nr:phosphoribosylformylglycinamidine synthase subunit PurQ [Oscillatoria laete-virens]MDK3157161.1 phosphoribosylformylglycinamidine synthase subunit PurQ [Kamptonema cortianum]MDL5051137.1 phosphoribosylformylglycinamidine synthase subunit PurQ [Oscillatoria amoena NRMC-F 0135]MDL5055043.1 phosphoribosylformylglycinamidine synthase subunit PurQ [Oscillatoria laete-virens NRMC-F 0139]
MHFGILQFPGSNCDQDMYGVASRLPGARASYIWHKDANIPEADVYVVPGGFSYGDYLRCGAIARFSPAMKEVVAKAAQGVPVIGICNGFQILCESGLLPGALVRNQNLHFICRQVHLRVETTDTAFTSSLEKASILRMPIAHGEGCYFADPETLRQLEDTGRIVFRYCDPAGEITKDANPNGSLGNIAGICNEARNVVGLMPHPERACDPLLGSADGLGIFESVIDSLARR